MGAIVKDSSLEMTLAAMQPAPRLFPNDALTPMRIMDLHEARQLSRFVPVVVLMPISLADQGDNATANAGNKSLAAKLGLSTLCELFGNAMTPKAQNQERDFVFGDVKVSFSSMETSRRGEPVTLRLMEFKTLKYFAQNARRVISRDELLNEVWGYEDYPCTRTVDNHVLKLRQKLEKDPSRPIHFQTVHGVGYKFLPDCGASDGESRN
jgi:DNA-binding winged helix-turn-helix (wHTH) protein